MKLKLSRPKLSPTRAVTVLDDALMNRIANMGTKDQRDYLFLSPHEQFAGRWYVDSLHQGFFIDFKDLIGRYRTVSPAGLEKFLAYAEERDYQVVFAEDPMGILDTWAHLNDPPSFKLNSDMAEFLEDKGLYQEAETVRATGMLPFQIQGFNYLRRHDIKGGLALWSTGTGKTALEAALIKQHFEVEDYQLGIVVVKRNNKNDTQRKLAQLGGIDYAFVVEGTPTRREEAYTIIDDLVSMGDRIVMIINYEKFRDDPEWIEALITRRKVAIFWDEMPTRLRNRGTQLYRSTCHALYASAPQVKWTSKRPSELRQYEFTATPIENDPGDQLSCIRLIDPDVFPTIKGWEDRFVASRNYFSKEPETFKDLDEMGLMLEFMTHQVDKEDEDIAKLFPKVREEIIYVDWDDRDLFVYSQMQALATELALKAKEGEGKKLNPLQMIAVLQMLCDAPSMVQRSADNRRAFEEELAALENEEDREAMAQLVSGSEAALKLLERLQKPLTDERHTKFKALHELLDKHKGEKFLVFSRFSNLIFPALEDKLNEWGITYVVYRGTEKQREEAKNSFRTDPNIRMFLSSDAGSDSIDLPEASVVVDYDLPLKWATRIQRRNRAHRVNSVHAWVTFYTLLMANSVEERILEIVMRKWGFHKGVFKGSMSEDALSARMTPEDLWYILTGESLD